jgi:hypothetical protein
VLVLLTSYGLCVSLEGALQPPDAGAVWLEARMYEDENRGNISDCSCRCAGAEPTVSNAIRDGLGANQPLTDKFWPAAL